MMGGGEEGLSLEGIGLFHLKMWNHYSKDLELKGFELIRTS